MKKLKEEKGSITLFVLIAMLFFVMYLIGLYVLNTNAEATQTAASKRIKDIYEQDINQIDDIYATKYYTDRNLVNAPKLTQGMTPVKWDGANWIDTTQNDIEWYNYQEKEWANVRLEDGSMFVWIPRYAYRITSNWHTKEMGTIDIEFLKNTSNETLSNREIIISSTTGQGNWLIPSAFYWDNNNNGNEDEGEVLTGFWVAKYEASNQNEKLQIKEGVTSWRGISTSDCFILCKEMNETKNEQTYGLITDKTKVEPHLMKNIEWGSITYLANSKYGNSEIGINNSEGYITGTGGVQASTTGNKTGVFDMNGGSNECMAAYLNNNFAKNNTNAIIAAELKYKDIYQASTEDTANQNYEVNKAKYGDAIYEVSANEQNAKSLWKNGYLQSTFGEKISIYRGGYSTLNPSIFTLYNASLDGVGTGNSFRPTIVVLK